jgi:hypothetical protein
MLKDFPHLLISYNCFVYLLYIKSNIKHFFGELICSLIIKSVVTKREMNEE